MEIIMIYSNPIIPGFYPDPSVCRVGDTYYLVNSSFTYFPGIPIFMSKDMASWTQIGNVLDRCSQVELTGLKHSLGIFAPTIRYNAGMFYVITTLVPKGNFIVTATDPAGPWSEPVFIDGAEGIDPSLYFEDGRCFYIGTCGDRTHEEYYGDNEIWLQELDLTTYQLLGKPIAIWKGAMKNAVWPEGPHLYKRGRFYYCMIAEGGTSWEHSETIARSEKLFGPYEGFKKNPILTHRHLGKKYPVKNVGHADMVEASDGQWYMVCLGSRPCDEYTGLGRETFLAEVEWEEDWPVVNPGLGRLDRIENESDVTEYYGFDSTKLDDALIMLRNPSPELYSFNKHESLLSLRYKAERLGDISNPAFIGTRQKTYDYIAETCIDGIEPEPENKNVRVPEREPEFGKKQAGLAIVQNDDSYLTFTVSTCDGKLELEVLRSMSSEREKIYSCIVERVKEGSPIALGIEQSGQSAGFYYETHNGRLMLPVTIDTRFLSTEEAGGFVGNIIGVYCTGNGLDTGACADFRYLKVYSRL